MKGLLLKDWYMMKTYCRAYLIIAVVFVTISVFESTNLFLVFYPCLLCGMIPVNLLSYDERSRFIQYSAALPYTRTQIVSAKYILGLLIQATILLITAVAQGVKAAINGGVQWQDLLVLLLTMLIIATLSSSFCLPFVFKMGVEKGRIAYYVMIGIVCAGSVIASRLFDSAAAPIKPNAMLFAMALAGIAVYALSWCLSVIFFKKREL